MTIDTLADRTAPTVRSNAAAPRTDLASMVTRTCLGAASLSVVAASLVAALGHPEWTLPILGGATWGMVNVFALARLSAYLRPDRPPITPRIVLEFTLKFPILYGIAALALFGRPADVVFAAAAGFSIVLMTMVLRALGAWWFGAGQASPSTARDAMEGLERAS